MKKLVRKPHKIEPKDIKDFLKIKVYFSDDKSEYFIPFKDDHVVLCTSKDGEYFTVAVPISQFNRGKYSYKFIDENGETKSKISTITCYK